MYWLLDEEYENLRQRIIKLQAEIIQPLKKEHSEQVFPFIGRERRTIAKIIIENLTKEDELISEPFGGSGIFAYSALDCNRNIIINEWEPYAFRMMSAPFRGVPNPQDFSAALEKFCDISKPTLDRLYRSRCPKCGTELTFDAIFFDREPEEYFNPMWHERMGPSNENVIFRQKFQCTCGCKEKNYDDFDESVRREIEEIDAKFLMLT